jgi:hypothetical protein
MDKEGTESADKAIPDYPYRQDSFPSGSANRCGEKESIENETSQV